MTPNEEHLWAQAHKLAEQRYTVTTQIDTLSNGQQVYLLRHPELRGCKAQGRTREEAEKNLEEARIDYIYALLLEGRPVPTPEMSAAAITSSSLPRTDVFIVNGSGTFDELDMVLDDRILKPDFRSYEISLSLGGDLVKQG